MMRYRPFPGLSVNFHRLILTTRYVFSILLIVIPASVLHAGTFDDPELVYSVDFNSMNDTLIPDGWTVSVDGRSQLITDHRSKRVLQVMSPGIGDATTQMIGPLWSLTHPDANTISAEIRVRHVQGTSNLYISSRHGHHIHLSLTEEGLLAYRDHRRLHTIGPLQEEWNVIGIVAHREREEVYVYFNNPDVPAAGPFSLRTPTSTWDGAYVLFQQSRNNKSEVHYSNIEAWAFDSDLTTIEELFPLQEDQTIPSIDLLGLWLSWQRDPTTTMTIDWHLSTVRQPDHPRPSVRFRQEGNSHWQQVEGVRIDWPSIPGRDLYRTELTQLQPDTRYEFRVAGHDRTFRFHTMRAQLDAPIRFAVGGDVRQGPQEWMEEMNRVVMGYDLDFIVWGGDVVNDNGEIANRWVRWSEAVLNTIVKDDGYVVPIVIGIGNHEVQGNGMHAHDGYEETDEWREKIAPYFINFLAFPGQPGYGVLDFGDYLSIVLPDTNHLNSVSGVQLEWLQKVLAEREHMRHIIPVYHQPAYPSTRQIGETALQIQKHWSPLFEQAGVGVAFEHHDHAFKRSVPILAGQPDRDGIVYHGDGGWGATTRDTHSPDDTWYLAKAQNIRSGRVVTISENGIHVLALSHEGDIIDEHSIVDGLYIESPKEDTIVAADEPIIIRIDDHIDIQSIIVEQNEHEIYRGDRLPNHLVLQEKAGIDIGEPTRLSVVVKERDGNVRRKEIGFFVRHIFLTAPDPLQIVRGDIPVVADVRLMGGETSDTFHINIRRILDGEQIEEKTLVEGRSWPGEVVLDTTVLEDGTYELDLVVQSTTGSVYSDHRRIIVDNWEIVVDEMEPPAQVGFFGLVDRSKTSERSEGWTYVANELPWSSYGSHHVVPSNEEYQYLTWAVPGLKKFNFVVHAPHKEAVDFVDIAVSEDGLRWKSVPFRIDVLRSMDGLVQLSLNGDTGRDRDAVFVSFRWGHGEIAEHDTIGLDQAEIWKLKE